MEWTTLNVGSVTNAMRGKSVLERHGIDSYIQRAFDAKDNNGCGYRLLIKTESDRARALLLQAGIRLKDGGAR